MSRRIASDWRFVGVLALVAGLGWGQLLIAALDSGSTWAYVGFVACVLLAAALYVVTGLRFAAQRKKRSE